MAATVTNARSAAAALREAAKALMGQAAALDKALGTTDPARHLGAVDQALEALDATLGTVERVVEWATAARVTLLGRIDAAKAPPAPAADSPAPAETVAPAAETAPMPSPAEVPAPTPDTAPAAAGKTAPAPKVGRRKPRKPAAPKANAGGLTAYQALKSRCRVAGLSAKGTTAELTARLAAHTAAPKADPAPAPKAPPAAGLKNGDHISLARECGIETATLVDALVRLGLALVRTK